MSADMEDKNILNILAEDKESFSRRQQNVARYICENCEKAAFMTAEMLSEAAGVSESTVVRFAVQLGFENYPDMRRAMQQVLRRRIINIYRPENNDEDSAAGELLMKTLANAAECLQNMESEKNRRSFNGIVEAVKNCNFIYIAGNGDKAPFCEYLSVRLAVVRGKTQAIVADTFSRLQYITKGDLLLHIGPSKRYGAEFMLAKDNGAETVLVWDGALTSEQKYADHSFVVPNDIALAAFADALIAAVGEAKGKSIETLREEANYLLSEYEKYER